MQGNTYHFVLPDAMQADKEAGKFLEANTVDGPHGSGMFGVAFSAISNVAATGTAYLSFLCTCQLAYGVEYPQGVSTPYILQGTGSTWCICSLTISVDRFLSHELCLRQ